MMPDDRRLVPIGGRPGANHRQHDKRSPPSVGAVSDVLRRAYAQTLAEPLPPTLADLLRRLE